MVNRFRGVSDVIAASDLVANRIRTLFRKQYLPHQSTASVLRRRTAE